MKLTFQAPTLPQSKVGNKVALNPEVVGLIPTEVKIIFSLPCVVP